MTISSFTGEYAFLSNFYPCDIFYEGIRYPSTEHAYQAAKTLDQEVRKQCLNWIPGITKRWGKSLPLRSDWELVKVPIMDELIKLKFSENSLLASRLLATSTHELIEGNTWGDTYWGVCRGRGKNMLGELLMHRRATLRLMYSS